MIKWFFNGEERGEISSAMSMFRGIGGEQQKHESKELPLEKTGVIKDGHKYAKLEQSMPASEKADSIWSTVLELLQIVWALLSPGQSSQPAGKSVSSRQEKQVGKPEITAPSPQASKRTSSYQEKQVVEKEINQSTLPSIKNLREEWLRKQSTDPSLKDFLRSLDDYYVTEAHFPRLDAKDHEKWLNELYALRLEVANGLVGQDIELDIKSIKSEMQKAVKEHDYGSVISIYDELESKKEKLIELLTQDASISYSSAVRANYNEITLLQEKILGLNQESEELANELNQLTPETTLTRLFILVASSNDRITWLNSMKGFTHEPLKSRIKEEIHLLKDLKVRAFNAIADRKVELTSKINENLMKKYISRLKNIALSLKIPFKVQTFSQLANDIRQGLQSQYAKKKEEGRKEELEELLKLNDFFNSVLSEAMNDPVDRNVLLQIADIQSWETVLTSAVADAVKLRSENFEKVRQQFFGY